MENDVAKGTREIFEAPEVPIELEEFPIPLFNIRAKALELAVQVQSAKTLFKSTLISRGQKAELDEPEDIIKVAKQFEEYLKDEN